MTNPKLSHTQTAILEAAAARDDGALLPAPDTVKARGGALKACLTSLLDRGLARDDGGVPAITKAGRQAIGLGAEPAPPRAPSRTAQAKTGQPKSAQPKAAQLVEHLQAPDGASIAELTEAFGWLPHSARAALTGLRKRGYAILRETRPDGVSAYRIEAEAG